MTIAAPLRTPLAAAPVAASGARRGRLLLSVLLLVGTVDQLSKAWAWRHLYLVHINSGSGLLFGDRAGQLYRDDLVGSLVDAVGVTLVLGLGLLLVRLRLPRTAFLGAAVVLAGWASNLADRIGLHGVTAPGSSRGVVDFLRWHGRLWNVADIAIIAGAATLTLGLLRLVLVRGPDREPAAPGRRVPL